MTTDVLQTENILSRAMGRPVVTSPRAIPANCIDLPAERAVLAAVLLDGVQEGSFGVWKRIRGIVQAEDFHHPPHAVLWEAFGQVLASGRDLDVVTCSAQLREMELLNTVGGAQAIGEITDEIPCIAHCESHAVIVAELGARRRLGGMLADHARKLASGAGTAAEVQAKAIQQLREMRLPGAKMPTMLADALAWSDRMKGRLNGEGMERVLKSSLADINMALDGGWRIGLNLIGSRPNIGKTMLTSQEVVHVAQTQGPAFYLSLESSRAQIMDQMIAYLSGVPLEVIQRPGAGITQDVVTRMFEAANTLASLPITVVDMSMKGCPRTVPALEAVLLSLPHSVVFVAIDHIRKMRAVGKHEQVRQGLGEIAETLHELALAQGIAINALIHVGRGPVKGATNIVPGMEHLKESGDLEESADSVVILHSEGRYPTKQYAEGEKPSNDLVDFLVPKLRNAKAGGYAKIRMEGAVQRFHSTMEDEDGDAPWSTTVTREPAPAPAPRRANGHTPPARQLAAPSPVEQAAADGTDWYEAADPFDLTDPDAPPLLRDS